MNLLSTCPLAFAVLSLSCLGQEAPLASSKLGDPAPKASQPSPTENIPGTTHSLETSGGYVIGPNDQLSVSVWKETSLSGNFLVRPDGMISMPLLGDVQSAGLTPSKLANDIAAKLKKYVQEPLVNVEIVQIRSRQIYTIGEVGKRGPIELAPGMTLLQAISSAGGLTDYADTKGIYILRVSEGKQIKIAVHYKQALKGNAILNLKLMPGDTIVVP